MGRKKPSLKGRGVDILLGGSADEQPKGPAAQPVAVTAEPEPTTLPGSVEAAPGPGVEAGPGAPMPNPFAEPAPALPVYAAKPTTEAGVADFNPFAEPASVSSSAAARPIAEAAATMPNPFAEPLPAAAAAPSAAEAASIALPSDPTLFKPAQYGGIAMSIEVMSGSGEYQPPTGVTQTGMKAVTLTSTGEQVSAEEVLQRIGSERIQGLSMRVDDLYAQVAGGAMANAEQAGEALSNLRTARDKELEDPRQFDEAEYLVNLVQYQINHSASIQQVRNWSYTWGVVVFIYGVFWLLVFGAGIAVSALGLVDQWLTDLALDEQTITTASALFLSVTSGGLGAVMGLLYSLNKHAAIQQDFDRQFLLWYYVQPFLGMLMGVIVNLFLFAGVFLVDATGPAIQAIGALLAIATAFRQNYVYAWLESLLRGFERRASAAEERREAEAPKPEVQPTTPTAPAGEAQGSPAGVG
ncbi:MAG TPA: hypothetical protein VFL17_16570 [Anaerolineae bacterium]|nr:hypothetical protein [Anaerolineae bacterium]